MTVLGTIDSSDLGVTLPHEHILNDVTSWWQRTTSVGLDPDEFATSPVTMDLLWDLKHDPFGNRDNCALDDVATATEEVARFAALGGGTIIDPTGLGVGRDLTGLQVVSRATGVNIVAGTGFYLEAAQPGAIADLDAAEIAELIMDDLRDGVDGVRPGIIGEIGVGQDFSPAERASLAAACMAQRETLLPIQIHLPAWFRLGDEVLDFVEAHSVDPAHVVLCHMGPSGPDPDYQLRLLRRGAWVQYDMVGAEMFYADQGVQCPSDEDNARHLAGLVETGFGDRLLISSDIFLKNLLRRNGGPGYGHVLQYFVPRLHRHGFDDDTIEQLMVRNPRAVFDNTKEA